MNVTKRKPSNLGLMALEPRWMFDGAAAVDAAHAAPDAAAKALIPVVTAPVEVRAADPSKDGGKKEVVFVDTSVAGYKALEAAVKSGIEIEEIDGGQSGLAQMAKWAETHTGYDSISLLSHGAEASVQIGTDTLNEAHLSDAVTQAELAEIGHSLNAGGDLLIYGCDVAKGDDGQKFISDLAAATGADVAASTDATGANGNWTLEARTGHISDTGFDGGNWSGDLGWSFIPGASVPTTLGANTAMAIDSSGAIYIAYSDPKPTVMKYADGVWSKVGGASASQTVSSDESIVIANDGTLYLAYRDVSNSSKPTVEKFSNGVWSIVGEAGFSPEVLRQSSFAVDSSGTPYLAFQDGIVAGPDGTNAAKLTVMKFTNGAWSVVGSAGFSPGAATNISLAIDSTGSPYVAFQDGYVLGDGSTGSNYAKATVMKFTGGAWSIVGSAGVSAGGAIYESLAIDSTDTPILAFQDIANGGAATVMKFSGGSWTTVGNVGVSAGSATNERLIAARDGKLYLAYQDGANGNGATAQTFDGTNWSVVGSANASGQQRVPQTIAMDQNGTIYMLLSEQFDVILGKIYTNSVTSIVRHTGSNPVATSSVLFDVTFSSPVINVSSRDFSLTGSDPSNGFVGTPTTTDGIHWTVPVTGIAGDGTVGLNFTGGLAAHASDETFTIDNTRPTIQSLTLNATSYKLGDRVTATIVTDAWDGNGAYTLDATSLVAGMSLSGWVYDTAAHTGTASFVVTGALPDILDGRSFYGTVSVSDVMGNSSSSFGAVFSGTLIDSHAPTSVSINGFSGTATLTGNCGIAGGATVGALTTIDGSTGDSFTYTLGGADAAKFQVVGGVLKIAAAQTLVGGTTYNITIQAADLGGNTLASPQAVAITAQGARVVFDAIPILGGVTANHNFTITGSIAGISSFSGSIQVEITVSGGDTFSGDVASNGTWSVEVPWYHYNYDTGDTDYAYFQNGANALTASYAALSGTVTGTASVLVDTAAPMITSVTLDRSTYKLGDTATVTIVTDAWDQNGPYTLFSGSTVDGATLSGWSYDTTSHTGTASFTVTASTQEVLNGRVLASIGVLDSLQNTGSRNNYITGMTIDTHSPTALAIAGFSGTTTLAGNSLLGTAGSVVGALTVTDVSTSHSGTNGSASDSFTYTLGGADAVQFQVVNGVLKVAAGQDLTLGNTYNITIQARDLGGNTLASAQAVTIAAGVSGPGISSIARHSGTGVSNAASMTYDVTFTQAVSGVDSTDFTLTNVSGSAGGSIVSVTDSGDHIHYAVTVSGIAGDGTERLDLKSSGTGIAATSDNSAITGGFTSGAQVTFDHTAPSITGVSLNAGAYKLGDTVTAIITTDAHDGNGAYTLATGSTIDGMTLTGWSYNTTTHSGTASFVVTGTTTEVIAGSVASSLSVADAAGNSGNAYTTAIAATTIDTHVPTDIAVAGQDSASHAYSGLATGSVVGTLGVTDSSIGDTFTYTLSGADAAKFQVVGGVLKVAPGITLADGTSYAVSITALDLGGNAVTKAFTVTGVSGPVFTSGASATFAENATGTVYTAAATASGGTVTYSLGGADAGKFNFDAGTGVLTFRRSPDHEVPGSAANSNSYNVTISATDSNGTATRAVVITVADVAPAWTAPSLAVADNVSTGTAVGTLVRTGDVSGTLWSIQGGNADGLFAINAATGAITIADAAKFNFAVSPSYILTVRQTDGVTNSDHPVSIAVTHVAAPASGGTSSNNGNGNARPGGGSGSTDAGGGGTGVGSGTGTPATGSTANTSSVTVIGGTAPNLGTGTGLGSGSAGTISTSESRSGAAAESRAGTPATTTAPAATNTVQAPAVIALAATGQLTAATSDGAFRVPVIAASQRASLGGEALVAVRPIAQVQETAAGFSFAVPADTFAHTRPDAVVNLTAAQQDGQALPTWLAFNPKTGAFTGKPPAGFEGVVVVRVVARDQDGREAIATIRISVGEKTAPVPAPAKTGQLHRDKPVGKLAFTQQLHMAGRNAAYARAAALAASVAHS